MPFLIDKVFILFIYVNVLAPAGVLSFPLGKLLVIGCFYLYCIHLFTSRSVVPKRVLFYLLTCVTMILTLAEVGSVKGNDFETIVEFVLPILILFMTPVLMVLFRRYGAERYLRHILYASGLLAAFVAVIYVLVDVLDVRDTAGAIIQIATYTSISFPEGRARIGVTPGGFFGPGLLFAYYFLKRTRRLRYTLPLLLISFAVFVSYTLGLWMGAVLGMVLFSLTAPARKSGRIAVVIVLACVTVGSAVWLAGDILLIKEESVSQKRSQTYEVLEVFSGSPLLGKGLGYRYRDTMVPSMSGSSEALLEVSYPMILSSTGIVGLIFYVFIYGYYPGRCLLVRRQRETFMILFAALVSVLVAAVGNPYIWGGGLGLFLIAVMGALYELEQSSLRARQFAGEGRRVGGQISMVASP